MTIPSTPNYPTSFDSDTTLFLVHDSLRLRLVEDYTPGDTSITVEDDSDVMDNFPDTGIITLTEQCSEPTLRAISFYYGSKTDTTFDELELMPGFTDVAKSKTVTNVTMNVYADHHNIIKDAVIAIQNFVGLEGTVDTAPFGDTLVGRLNFMKNLVLPPRAWFTSNKRIGIAPLTVTFQDESFRDPTSWIWNFGDGSTLPSDSLSEIICTDVSVPDDAYLAKDTDGGIIRKTYFTPGTYDVTLIVRNDYGEDTVKFTDYVHVRAPAPDEAEVTVSPSKVKTGALVNLEVTDNGEQQDSDNNAIDAVVEYTWNASDDLAHANSASTVAIYSVGGIYDIKVRIDTELGAYRITTLEDAVNVVEDVNLWLWAFDSVKTNLDTTKNLNTYEFGLISETFKTNAMPQLSVTRNDDFMSSYTELDYQQALFRRNVDFAQKGTTASGDLGQGVLYWAEDSTTTRFKQAEPFNEQWTSAGLAVGETETRNWNWTSLNTPDSIFLFLSLASIADEPTSASLSKSKHSLSSTSISLTSFSSSNLVNGADELQTLPDNRPATYRTAFQGNKGYIARNDAGPGGFFRIRSFYRADGFLSSTVQDLIKLNDIPGNARTELELVPLTSGIFVFNNSGEVSAYNVTTNTWTTGGPGVGSASFRSLQDSDVDGFSEESQPLRATSDGDRRAYLSFDYSKEAFIKFSEIDNTFTSVGSRPTANEQFTMKIF